MLFLWHVENARASKGAFHHLGAFIHIPDSRPPCGNANLYMQIALSALKVVKLGQETTLIHDLIQATSAPEYMYCMCVYTLPIVYIYCQYTLVYINKPYKSS